MAEDLRVPASSGMRVSPRRDPGAPVHLAPVAGHRLDRCELEATISRLDADGYRWIRTSALSDLEAVPFAEAGFVPCGHLVLLGCPIGRDRAGARRPRLPAGARIRRGRTRDRPALIDLDHRCFPDPWRFDETLLDDALGATPITRFRVVETPEVGGYAICGVAGPTAYLQRLAVDTSQRRRGLGRALVDDARGWASRRGARAMMVNTAAENDDAVSFYQRLGFDRRPNRLTVMERRRPEPGAGADG